MSTKLEQALRAEGIFFDANQRSSGKSEDFFVDFLTLIASDIRRIQKSAALRGFNLPTPSIAFVADTKLNAFANRIEDEYCIGINVGTVYVLNDIFNKIFSSREAFPNYGDPSGERGVPIGVSPLITDADILINNPAFRGSMPVDPVRATAAGLLTVLATRFLVLHEYGHIVNGHIDYKYSTARVLRFDEAPTPEPANVFSPLDSQTLEMDADCFATQLGLKMALSAHLYEGEDFELLARDKKEAVNLWHTAVHVLFRLFADVRPESQNSAENTYPSFGARIRGHKGFIASLLLSDYTSSDRQELGIEGASFEDILRMSMEHFQWVEKAFMEMYPTEFANHAAMLYNEQFSEPAHEVFNNRTRHWAVLRPKLLPYAKGSLAPVQT